MKKTILLAVLVISILAISGIAMAQGSSASDTSTRYYVKSTNGVLKAMFGVKHNFDNGFSTELSPGQVKLLGTFGVKTELVPIYHIVGKPTCDYDSICEPELGENPSCPDCKAVEEEPTCFPTESTPWGITRVNGGLDGSGVKVAVLDTGIDQDHPDFTDNIVDCVSFVTHFRPDIKSCEDKNGHGTHVAGTIAANGKILGVAPEATLIIVKVCDSKGRCYGDDMAAGISYAVVSGANIISMSVGGDIPDSEVLSAIDVAVNNGVLVIAAAGNDGHIDGTGSVDYPAADPNVVAVGAIDSNDNLAYFSSLGGSECSDGDTKGCVELVAPGVSIESTWNDGCYNTIQGTSMATPHVAGLAAKLWQNNAANTRSYLRSIIVDIGEIGYDTATGYGLPVAP